MTREELLTLIDQAHQEGWKKLDLAGKNLTELPPKIGRLTHLEILILARTEDDGEYVGNQLTALPPEIGQLQNLKVLKVAGNRQTPASGNWLNAIPSEIGQLKNLTSLDLSSNQLSTLPPEIVQLTNLKALDLSSNQLSTLLPEIIQLKNLKWLDLSSNQLGELPPEVSQLKNLKWLDLSSNQLSKLPSEISRLNHLQTLKLSNQLSELPPEIIQLTNLTSLDLSFNQLSELPPEIIQLTNLTSLDLSCNQLLELPPEIVQLTNLKWLDLSHNQLSGRPRSGLHRISWELETLSECEPSGLPPEIVQLTNLRSLNLSDNDLNTLPAEIVQLTNLTSLDLSRNYLNWLPPEMGQLTNLRSLNLRANDRLNWLPSEIVQLTNLTSLDLSNNNLTGLQSEIGQLTNLQSLNLRGNHLMGLSPAIGQLTNLRSLSLMIMGGSAFELPPEIGQLTNLRSLSLMIMKRWAFELPPEIGQLTNLRSLKLSCTQLSTLPPEIGQLTNLQSFSLWSKYLNELPSEIGQLTNLRSLRLSCAQLSTLPPEIGQLTNLQSLDLRDTQLSTLPPEISQLTNLRSLDLSRNQLSELSPEIGQLINLQSLDLSNNQLRELPSGIDQLIDLRSLDLSSNQLCELPSGIGSLIDLQSLDLSRNQLHKLPTEISQLIDLRSLNLSSNQLRELPSETGQLIDLRSLDLSSNELRELPLGIGQLITLQSLNLNSNQLRELPPGIVQLPQLETLDLRYNPVPIPPEILGSKEIDKSSGNKQAILDFYAQVQDPVKTEPLYEAKLLIVGEGASGKTTLAKKIDNANYQLDPKQKTTEGIDVIRWDFNLPDGTPFRVNIWDFGGQEIYHATHQFFLTKRSVYALLVDDRRESPNLHYWLSVVELLSENSPVIIIKNCKQNRRFQINERQLRGEFDNIQSFLPTNLATNDGLEHILTVVKHHMSLLPHVGTPLPKTWVRVRAALENYANRSNYIHANDFFDICKDNDFTNRKAILNLSQYLHDLGVCLHFQEDPILKNTMILRPEWATKAVYTVLDTPKIKEAMGCFSRNDLEEIWQDREYDDMRDELLKLMMLFQLCYEIPGRSHHYMAPQLLDIEQPEYRWDDNQNLILRYEYEFMPKGILTRLIVIMHDYIEEQRLVWREGVILYNGRARAEIIEFYHKGELHIRVSGYDQKSFLSVITHELDKINRSYERLIVNTLIPCNCVTCKGNPKPHSYPLERLHTFQKDGQYQIQCQKKPYEMVDVRGLLNEILASPSEQVSKDTASSKNELLPCFDLSHPDSTHQGPNNININVQTQLYQEQNQKRNSMGNLYQNHSGSGDNIARDKNITNNYTQQDLTRAAQDIKALLDQLSADYDISNPTGQMKVGTQAIEAIEKDPTFKTRVVEALKGAGAEALMQAIQHPVAQVFIAGAKSFIDL